MEAMSCKQISPKRKNDDLAFLKLLDPLQFRFQTHSGSEDMAIPKPLGHFEANCLKRAPLNVWEAHLMQSLTSGVRHRL